MKECGRRGVLRDDGQQGRLARPGGQAAAPVVYLAVTRAKRAKAAWLTPARASKAASFVCESALLAPQHGTQFQDGAAPLTAALIPL